MLIPLLVLGILTLSTGLAASLLMSRRARILRELVAREIDLSKLPNGVYAGTLRRGSASYDLVVRVRGQRVVSVGKVLVGSSADSAEDEGVGRDTARDDQSVDVVSGATLSTKAFGAAGKSLPSLRH